MRPVVIVTTYNRPDALAAVLEGYLGQSDLDFELVVADDGSDERTAAVVQSYKARGIVPIEHVWQEDRGFRAAAIRNKAVAMTAADYIVFTDGDCVPAPGFVAAHKRLAERGWFLAGNRILLSEALTKRVLAERLPVHRWGWKRWLAERASRNVNRLLPLLRLPDGGFRRAQPNRWEGAKTCNLSVWRDALARVNGLDERYEGWGLEDSDLVIRLLHAGERHKNARFAAPLFHLWHAEQPREALARNAARLEEILGSSRLRAERGLDQYLS
jgi:glycosyltransferase involved in cell wall biosynthesis